MGAGVGLTRILFGKGERAGLEIDEDSPASGVEVSGLSLVAPDPTSVPAITVRCASFASTQHGPSIHDVDIRSGDALSIWREGVVLEHGAYGTLRDVSVSGTPPRTKSGVDPRTGLGSCFRLTAGSIGVEVDHATYYYAITGMTIEGDSEGVKVHDSEFVAVTIGLDAVGGRNKDHASPPSIIVSRNHINSYRVGAKFTAWSLYQRPSGLTGMRPLAHGDGGDGAWLLCEPVPGVTGSVDDGLIAVEDAVRQPVRPQVLPDVLPLRQAQEGSARAPARAGKPS